jgi:hypothetical protein
LNGSLFDVKMVQLICLNFCVRLRTEGGNEEEGDRRPVRDLVGLAAIEGFHVVQEEIQSEETPARKAAEAT